MFLRSCVAEPLEERRQAVLHGSAVRVQAAWRGHTQLQQYRRVWRAAKRIQEYFLSWKLRIRFRRQRRAAVVIQVGVSVGRSVLLTLPGAGPSAGNVRAGGGGGAAGGAAGGGGEAAGGGGGGPEPAHH